MSPSGISRNRNSGHLSKTDIPIRPIHVHHMKSVVQTISTSRHPVKSVVQKRLNSVSEMRSLDNINIYKVLVNIVCSDSWTEWTAVSEFKIQDNSNEERLTKLFAWKHFICVRNHLSNNRKLQTITVDGP